MLFGNTVPLHEWQHKYDSAAVYLYVVRSGYHSVSLYHSVFNHYTEWCDSAALSPVYIFIYSYQTFFLLKLNHGFVLQELVELHVVAPISLLCLY